MLRSEAKVWVSIPTKGSLRAETVLWILSQPDIGVDIVQTRLPLEHARNLAVSRFLNGPAEWTHFYTLDSDCIPADGTLERLLQHNLPFISSPHACIIEGEKGYMAVDEIEPGRYKQHHPMRGLQRCDAVGGSGLLVRRDVLERIEPPWFKFEYDGNGLLVGGEDFYFCRKLREAGYLVVADFDVPQQHVVEDRI